MAGYLGVLEDLLLAYRIPVFAKRANRAVVAHPKFYYFDAGVFTSLRPSGPLDRPGEIGGAALEGLVAQHIRAWLSYSRSKGELYYWRTKAGSEVDFVVYGDIGFWAVDVKNTSTFQRSDLRPLRAFGEEYPEARRVFLYRGEEEALVDGIVCMPCANFLKQLLPDSPLLCR